MNPKERNLQKSFVVEFFTNKKYGLGYNEVPANTVDTKNFIIEEDLKAFLNASFNKDKYQQVLQKYHNDEQTMIDELKQSLVLEMRSCDNMAIFLNKNQTFSFGGVSFILYAPSGSETSGDNDFNENVFSVVQELPFQYKDGDCRISIRPDITFFLNGFFLGYCELKSLWNNQNANDGRIKVVNDYKTAVNAYLPLAKGNDKSRAIRRNALYIFEKAIHVTASDVNETFVIRNFEPLFNYIRDTQLTKSQFYNEEEFKRITKANFKPYPVRNVDAGLKERFQEIFTALYSKKMIEKEILYYNFLQYEWIEQKGQKVLKSHRDKLISPRPKQKFGCDKIIDRIPEFLEHENDPDYYTNKIIEELKKHNVNDAQILKRVEERKRYKNNQNVYSLLLQYAAGFGKSNIIGWTALQLKDLRDKNGKYVYDKVLLVVDRLQLRDQIDTMLHNMNIEKGMFIEATNKKTFSEALTKSERIVVVNIQKFTSVKNDMISKEAMEKLSKMRVCFLIDEIHRSNSGTQHEEMILLFDELQNAFDDNEKYIKTHTKKNLIIGFTATPSDEALIRFGELKFFKNTEPAFVPFDSYTMLQAIQDEYILDPLKGLVAVAAKMYFANPIELNGIAESSEISDEEKIKQYRIRKEKIYSNDERREAICHIIVKVLLDTTYKKIHRQGKGMLAVSSVPNAIAYKVMLDRIYREKVESEPKKYGEFAEAPIFIIYSDKQGVAPCSSLNGGLTEERVLQEFQVCKNGLIIVVDKLQTGFDEPKLHTLFLDKEIRGINAIQTISRVDRKCNFKKDCLIYDFSHKNVNIANIHKAFEKFCDVVISDLNPLEYEKTMIEMYKFLLKQSIYKDLIDEYKKIVTIQKDDNDEQIAVMVGDSIAFIDKLKQFITNNKELATTIKNNASTFFHILGMLSPLITIDKKYKDPYFLGFWREYSIIYNQLNVIEIDRDDIEIYFDDRIGILTPDEKTTGTPKGKGKKAKTGKPRKYDITKILEKLNEEEEEIEKKIEEFEEQITAFFRFIETSKDGTRFIAKLTSTGQAFSEEDLLKDFIKLLNKFLIVNASIDKTFVTVFTGNEGVLMEDFRKYITDRIVMGEYKAK
ncbi:MAG: type I restriction endonuclease subunit R [Bacteroidales bacterium]|nr:type I restriction endonuclease subunit R [Bacteroidales bacterium]